MAGADGARRAVPKSADAVASADCVRGHVAGQRTITAAFTTPQSAKQLVYNGNAAETAATVSKPQAPLVSASDSISDNFKLQVEAPSASPAAPTDLASKQVGNDPESAGM